VGAFGEEVVAAVALAQVVVLPWLLAAGRCAGEDAVAVDEDLDGAHVAAEVVGALVGGRQGALQDFGVVAGAGRVLVAKPLLQVGQRQWLLGVEQLGGDGGSGAVAGQRAAGVGFGDPGLGAEDRDELLIEVGAADELGAVAEQVLASLTGLAICDRRLRGANKLPYFDQFANDWVDRFGERPRSLRPPEVT